jgi:hypothetical protein
MYKLIACFLLLTSFFIECKNVNAQVPPVFSDKRQYKSLREEAISLGWIPKIMEFLPEKQFVQRTGFLELQGCSGSGRGFCRFEFQKNDYVLTVVTVPGSRNNKINIDDPVLYSMTLSFPKTKVDSWKNLGRNIIFNPYPLVKSSNSITVDFSDNDNGSYGMWSVNCQTRKYKIITYGGLSEGKITPPNYYAIGQHRFSRSESWINPSSKYNEYQASIVSLICANY